MVRGSLVPLIVSAVLLLPAAAAQEPPEAPPLANHSISLAASPGNEPVTPITETRTTSVNVTVTCEQGSVYTGTTPAGAPVQVHYAVDTSHPEAVAVTNKLTFNPPFTPEGCLQGMQVSDNVDVIVTLAGEALAGDTVTIDFTARLEDVNESVSWDHTVGHYFRHQARFEEASHRGAPGETVEIHGVVSNFGNADVRFVFNELPDDGRRLTLTLPEPLVVAPFTEGIGFTVRADLPPSDSYIDRRDVVILRVQALLEGDPTVAGEPEDLNAVVHTQGGAGESPGPALPFLVVLLTALWAGRRRTVSTI